MEVYVCACLEAEGLHGLSSAHAMSGIWLVCADWQFRVLGWWRWVVVVPLPLA